MEPFGGSPVNRKLSLAKNKIKILLLEGIHQTAVEMFRSQGYTQVEHLPTALTGEALKEKIRDAHMVGIRSRSKLTPEVLAEADKLMAIGCFCIGTNQVDLQDASLRGIPVFNAPHSNTRSVAELVIGQTIMLARGTFPKSMAAHRSQWQKSASGSHEVRGKTMGIVGYGHIGSQVSILAEAMGMRVVYYDIQRKQPLGNAKPLPDLKSLLAESDVVTLHVPEDTTTKGLFNQKQIAQMKPGSFLINASRGSVVDIDALASALKKGSLGGAAVDVFPVEPKSNEHPFESPLVGLDQVILTPHVGGSTQEAQEDIGRGVAQSLTTFSDTGSTDGAVNFPIVNLPTNPGSHRILHIHRNIPGVLREINKAMAEEEINVLGQYLATDPHIGYVVLDIAKDMSAKLSKVLKDVNGTIRIRVLY